MELLCSDLPLDVMDIHYRTMEGLVLRSKKLEKSILSWKFNFSGIFGLGTLPHIDVSYEYSEKILFEKK